MAKSKIDKDVRKAINDAKKMIEDVARKDGNEAETRRRVERMFDSIMGYDIFENITREHAVKGAGDTEYCDFAIQLEHSEKAKPIIFVELKRVGIDLAPKHLKQVSGYAINAGCEWIVLTNGKEWRLYHVSFGQPPKTKLVKSWDLLHDTPESLASSFEVISYRNIRKDGLANLWEKANTLTTRNVLSAILAKDSIVLLRRILNRKSNVTVTPEEVIGAVRRLLNESALSEMEDMRIVLPERKKRTAQKKKVAEPAATDTPTKSEEEQSKGID